MREDSNNQKYYRLEINGLGGLFRHCGKVIDAARESEDDDIYDSANRLDGLIGQLEEELYYPEIELSKASKFAYTEEKFNRINSMKSYYDSNLSVIQDISETLNDLGYDLNIIEIEPNKINYTDDQQIAYERLAEDKNFVPKDVKKDTCVAVAYSMLTGIDYDDALKMFPNGKVDTIKKQLAIDYPDEKEKVLNTFMLKHPSGRYLISIADNKHRDGHAIALIDGVAYNTQDFDRNSKVIFYTDLSTMSKVKTNNTSYLDEFEKHKNIKDNKYINYAYQKIVDTLRDDLAEDGKIKTTVSTKGTNGFELNINNNRFEFNFPFNCTERDIQQEIDAVIEKNKKKDCIIYI